MLNNREIRNTKYDIRNTIYELARRLPAVCLAGPFGGIRATALYTCRISSTNSPFYAKQTQSCPPPADSKPLIRQRLTKMNHDFRLAKNKAKQSQPVAAKPPCHSEVLREAGMAKPGQTRSEAQIPTGELLEILRPGTKQNVLAPAKCSTKPGWRSRAKLEAKRRSLRVSFSKSSSRGPNRPNSSPVPLPRNTPSPLEPFLLLCRD